MDMRIRNATTNDYESVIKIISQVQDMHVEWRPDIYKYNDNLIAKEEFEKIVENNTYFIFVLCNKKSIVFYYLLKFFFCLKDCFQSKFIKFEYKD